MNHVCMPLTADQPLRRTHNDRLRLFAVPLLLLLASAASLAIDLRVARFFKQGQHSKLVRELFDIAEPFGHGIGAFTILVVVVLLDPGKLTRCGWLAGGSLGAGALASVAKLLVPRTRPRAFDLSDGEVWQTFVGWWPAQYGASIQSFPSSHTTTAVGLAVVLSAWYPRGRWLFATLAVLVGLQRQDCLAHFPSDVLAGAALGWFVGTCCVLGDRSWSKSETQPDATSG